LEFPVKAAFRFQSISPSHLGNCRGARGFLKGHTGEEEEGLRIVEIREPP